MKVIGAGFGRTGTTSLKAALEELGFDKCYHMQELFQHPEHAEVWLRAWRGEPVDWPAFFAGYQATVDWPGCTFYQQLMDVYPDAKVLLSVREPDRWYESSHKTIYQISRAPAMGLLQRSLPRLRKMYGMVCTLVWQGTFDGRFSDRAHAIEVFEAHNRAVQEYVPPERLLVYSVKEGWEPLCNFLDVPVPEDKPFPHLNDAAIMQRAIRISNVLIAALGMGLVSLVLWLAAQIIKRNAGSQSTLDR